MIAEAVLARGEADLVSTARPLPADPEFAKAASAGRAEEINGGPAASPREVVMLQRKPGRMGRGLGVGTGGCCDCCSPGAR